MRHARRMPENWFTEKKINMVLRLSETKTPEIPDDVPWVGEFVTVAGGHEGAAAAHRRQRIRPAIVASRQVPPEQIEMLRAAFDATMRDPNYLAFAAKRGLGTSAVSGKEAQDMIAQIFTASKAVVDRAREVIK